MCAVRPRGLPFPGSYPALLLWFDAKGFLWGILDVPSGHTGSAGMFPLDTLAVQGCFLSAQHTRQQLELTDACCPKLLSSLQEPTYNDDGLLSSFIMKKCCLLKCFLKVQDCRAVIL